MDEEIMKIYKKELTLEDAYDLYNHFGIATIYHNGKIEYVGD